jgi:hypothetical protein
VAHDRQRSERQSRRLSQLSCARTQPIDRKHNAGTRWQFRLQRPVFELKKRLSQNYQLLASYTFSKVIDGVPDATAVVPFSSDDAKMVADPLNPGLDRGPGVNDQRHRFVFSALWDLDNYARHFSLAPATCWVAGSSAAF